MNKKIVFYAEKFINDRLTKSETFALKNFMNNDKSFANDFKFFLQMNATMNVYTQNYVSPVNKILSIKKKNNINLRRVLRYAASILIFVCLSIFLTNNIVQKKYTEESQKLKEQIKHGKSQIVKNKKLLSGLHDIRKKNIELVKNKKVLEKENAELKSNKENIFKRACKFLISGKDPDYEKRLSDYFLGSIRSSDKVFPENDYIFNSFESINFNWEILETDAVVTLTVFNKNSVYYVINGIYERHTIPKKTLKHGLYYWKLELFGEEVYLGKFYIY